MNELRDYVNYTTIKLFFLNLVYTPLPHSGCHWVIAFLLYMLFILFLFHIFIPLIHLGLCFLLLIWCTKLTISLLPSSRPLPPFSPPLGPSLLVMRKSRPHGETTYVCSSQQGAEVAAHGQHQLADKWRRKKGTITGFQFPAPAPTQLTSPREELPHDESSPNYRFLRY